MRKDWLYGQSFFYFTERSQLYTERSQLYTERSRGGIFGRVVNEEYIMENEMEKLKNVRTEKWKNEMKNILMIHFSILPFISFLVDALRVGWDSYL